MITIGLTGPYCAGKNQVADLFIARGFPMIEVDALGHEALREAQGELVSAFGAGIVSGDGGIDRKRLGVLVFADADKLRKLESIVHPRMVASCIRLLEQYGKADTVAVVVNAALLHRMHLDAVCDAVCFVTSPLWVRYRRAVDRDHATCRSFFRIWRAQRDIAPSGIDGPAILHIVKNSRDRAFIHRQVDEFCATMGI